MATSLAPGELVLGKYRVERVIGQGGMGIVVAARHTGLGELFAIKLMLNVEGAAGRQAIDRFLREARICASLKGEHVVKVQDVGELEDGRPYMVMEYLEGQDLGSIIKKRGPLTVANAAAIVLQACEALAEAHRLGIVHRDVKPPNMFMMRNPNGKVRLKLLDFGISKRVGAETKALTATGAMMGSPLYMSPEQLTDPRLVGPQTDIWAMGIVLYELLTGKVPFDGEMIFQVIQEILNKTPALPSVHRPSLPVEVDKIIVRALRKEPSERYATIEEFARDVRQLLQANSVIDSNFNLTGSSEPEVNIEIESAAYNAISYGPTVEVSSENVAADASNEVSSAVTGDKPIDQAAIKNKTIVSKRPEVATQSDLTKSVSRPGSPKAMSPAILGIGAVVLLVVGGGIVYLVQGGSHAASSAMVVPESHSATNPIAVSIAPPVPQVTVEAASSAAPVVSSAEPASSVAPAASSAAPIGGKPKTLSTAAGAKTAPTSTAKRREGLF